MTFVQFADDAWELGVDMLFLSEPGTLQPFPELGMISMATPLTFLGVGV